MAAPATLADLLALIPADQLQLSADQTALKALQDQVTALQTKITNDGVTITADTTNFSAPLKLVGPLTAVSTDPSGATIYTTYASADGITFTTTVSKPITIAIPPPPAPPTIPPAA